MSDAVRSAPREISDLAWKAIQGACDLHVHVSPDVIDRSIDDLGLARAFLERGLRGFVLKSHYVPTAERAAVVRKACPGICAYGAVALNHSVGGFNPVAVEIAGRSGARIVWMPTVDALNETAARSRGLSTESEPFWAGIQRELLTQGIAPPPLALLDASGAVREDVIRCLERIAAHAMVLATGHLSRDEIFALVPRAVALGITKIVVTHAEFPSQSLTGDDQRRLAAMGAVLEHCYTTTHSGKANWDLLFANVRATGVEQVILSTDLGQKGNPAVVDGLAMFAQRFLDAGFSAGDVHHMTAVLPASLLEA